MVRGKAHFDNLHRQFVVKEANAQFVGPEALGRRERVDADTGAHLLEVAPELRVPPDLLAVLPCELLQAHRERRQLRRQLRQLLRRQLAALLLELRLKDTSH